LRHLIGNALIDSNNKGDKRTFRKVGEQSKGLYKLVLYPRILCNYFQKERSNRNIGGSAGQVPECVPQLVVPAMEDQQAVAIVDPGPKFTEEKGKTKETNIVRVQVAERTMASKDERTVVQYEEDILCTFEEASRDGNYLDFFSSEDFLAMDLAPQQASRDGNYLDFFSSEDFLAMDLVPQQASRDEDFMDYDELKEHLKLSRLSFQNLINNSFRICYFQM